MTTLLTTHVSLQSSSASENLQGESRNRLTKTSGETMTKEKR